MEKKKVIFYNVTVESILKYKKEALKKMYSVFQMFQKWDNVVLLWRPHPLLEATFKSMLPDLFDEYRKLVALFKEKKWGIYDDTADMYNAIAISDAYFGDWSSVIMLYEVTGKPIMIQNMENLYEEEKEDLRFAIASCIWIPWDEKVSYFVTPSMNGLFSYHIDDGTTELINPLEAEEENGQLLYYTAAKCNGKILISPYNAENFVLYNVNRNTVKYFNIREISGQQKDFYYLVSNDNAIYAVGCETQKILKFDLEMESFESLDCNYVGKAHPYSLYFYQQEKLSLLNAGEGEIWEFDTKKEKVELRYPKDGNMEIGQSLWDGNKYWLVLSDKNLISGWDISSNDMVDIKLPDNAGKVTKMIGTDKEIWVFFETGNVVFKIDKNSLLTETIFMEALNNSFKHRFIKSNSDWVLVRNYIKTENRYLLKEEYYFYLNYRTGEEKRIEFKFPYSWGEHKKAKIYFNYLRKKYHDITSRKSYVYEDKYIDISFLHILVLMTDRVNRQPVDINYGKEIHKKICDLL